MTEPSERALARLQDPEGAALTALARLVVLETTATPLAQIASPRWIAGQVATALEAFTRTEAAREWIHERIQAERARWSNETRTLRHWVPREAEDPLRALLERDWTPSRDLTVRLIDQPAMHDLVRVVLQDTLVRFGRRLRSVDQGLLGGLGGRTAKRSRGLFANVAENLVGAVAEEVEVQLEKRVTEFVGTATHEAVLVIAAHLSNPKHASAYADFRLGALDTLLSTPIAELADEADKARPEDMVDVVLGAMKAAVRREDFVEITAERIEALLAEAGDGTLGAWLEQVELRDVWVETTTELVAQRLQAVVLTDGFTQWWTSLFA